MFLLDIMAESCYANCPRVRQLRSFGSDATEYAVPRDQELIWNEIGKEAEFLTEGCPGPEEYVEEVKRPLAFPRVRQALGMKTVEYTVRKRYHCKTNQPNEQFDSI